MSDDELDRRLQSDGKAWRAMGGFGTTDEHDRALREALLRAKDGPRRLRFPPRILATISAAAIVVVVSGTAWLINVQGSHHPRPQAPPVGTAVQGPSCPPTTGVGAYQTQQFRKGDAVKTRSTGPRLAAATAALIALPLASCTSSATASKSPSQTRSVPSSGPTTTTATTTKPAASATSAANPPASPTASTRTSSGSGTGPAGSPGPDCTNSQLSLRSTGAQGGDSNGGLIVIFTNTSRTTCSLFGYPGAALVDSNGHQFAQAKRALEGYTSGCSCSHPLRIRITPGSSASTVVEGNNAGGNECLRGHTVLVTPPNTTKSASLPYLDAYSCNVQIHPVVSGTSGGNRH